MGTFLLNSFFKTSRSLCGSYFHSFLTKDSLKLCTLKLSASRCEYRSITDYKRKSVSSNRNILQPHVYFKLLRLIKGAIKESGPVIANNEKLGSLIQKADELNLPADFIDYAIKIAVDVRAKVGIYEMLYLNQGYLILQYEVTDLSNTKHHLLQICEKYDSYLISGKVKWDQNFNLKGMLSVKSKDSHPLTDGTEVEKIASKIGVQSVIKEIDLGDWSFWQFHCEPNEIHKTKLLLQKEGIEVEEAFVGFIPKREIHLPVQAKRIILSMISDIGKLPEIDNLYTNIIL